MTFKEFWQHLQEDKALRNDILKRIAISLAVPTIAVGGPSYVMWKGKQEPAAARADVIDRGYRSLEYIGRAPVSACPGRSITYHRDAFTAVASSGRTVHVARCRHMGSPVVQVHTYRPK